MGAGNPLRIRPWPTSTYWCRARAPAVAIPTEGVVASVGGLFGLERGATDRRRPDLADLLTPLRGGVGCERECSRFSPLAVPPLLAMIRLGGYPEGGFPKGGN